MKKTFKANKDSLPEVTEFVEDVLESLDCPMRETMQISVAVEEIFVNIASYAYPDTAGDADVTIESTDNNIIISFEDSGVPFNPLDKEDPDVAAKAEGDSIGGLGIYMVKKTMDNVEYRYENHHNLLVISKNW